MNELVSVVIPTYNHARFLGRALQSVLAQTYSDWEAIVVDNHSTDDTDAVIAATADPRIRVVKIRNNGVIAASRNLGIREVRGKWIAFLDSDDSWYPAKLETVMRAAADDACDVISHDELLVDSVTGTNRILRHGPYQSDFYEALLLDGNCLSPSATTVRREFLLRHGLGFGASPEFVTVEDYDLWLHLARTGARFHFVHEVLGEYVIHAFNISSGLERHWQNSELLLRHHVFEVQRFDPSPQRLWRKIEARLALARIRHLAGTRRFAAALRLAVKTAVELPAESLRYLIARKTRLSRGAEV